MSQTANSLSSLNGLRVSDRKVWTAISKFLAVKIVNLSG